ncbi:MAG: MATE family efflux transporter [Henriciella sp.]|nr:MATE family efflux transporter [Henriciella sp.]
MTQQRVLPAWAQASEIIDLLRLAAPIAVSRMAWMLMGLTDAIVLGQISGQEHELSFILNSWLPIGVALGLGMGLLLGVQVLTSEMLGRGEQHQSGRIFRRGLLWSVGLGFGLMALVYISADSLYRLLFVEINPNNDISEILTPEEFANETAIVTRILSFSLLGFMISTACGYYLEALRRPLLVTITSYLGVGINLIIDLALVAGWWGMPQMGAEGVAWATTGSRWTITIALMIFVIWLTPAFAPSDRGPADEPKRQLKVGVGTAVSNVAEWGGFNLTFTIAAFISVAANVVYGYSVQVMGFCFMFFLGIGTATSVRVAEQVGRNDRVGVRDASRLGVAATFAVGTLLAIGIYLFKDQIVLGLVNERAKADGVLLAPAIAALMIYAAIATTFDGLQATASMALRAQGIVWLPTAIHIASFFVLMIPAGYLFGIVWDRGAQGMMEAALLALLVAGAAQWALLEWKTARHI